MTPPTPISRDDISKVVQDVLAEYENFYKIGYDHGRDGDEKSWKTAMGVTAKHHKIVMSRIDAYVAQEVAKEKLVCLANAIRISELESENGHMRDAINTLLSYARKEES